VTRRRQALVLAALAALPSLPGLLGVRAFFQRDVVNYWLPTIEEFVRQAAAGEWPLWNPNVGFGAPLWADPNFQWAYPTTWLNLLLPPGLAFAALVASHAAWGALGTRRLAAAAGAGAGPSFLAGLAFAWAGPWLSSATLWHHYCGVAWAPWVLLALEQLAARPGARRVAALGASAGAAALAGSADACLMILLLALARIPALVAASPSRSAFAAAAASAAALAAGLAAVQWLPTAHVLAAGLRGAMPESARLYWSLHPASLVDLAVPRLLASAPWNAATRGALYEGREPLIEGLYLGTGVLMLAALALLAAERRQLARGLAIAMFVLLGLALGRHGLLSGVLALPGFAQLRYPAKYLWLVPLLASLLAALGAQALPRARASALTAVARAGLAVAALFATLAAALVVRPGALVPWLAAGTDSRAVALAAATSLGQAALVAGATALLMRFRAGQPGSIAAVALLDLGLFALGQHAWAPPELLAHRPLVVRALHEEAASRVVVRRGSQRLEDELRFGPAGWEPEPRFVLGLQDLLLPPAAARWGLRGSFDGDFTGLAPRPTSALTALAAGAGAPEARARLLRWGGVSHLVTLEERPPVAGAEPIAAFPSVFREPVRLFRLSSPLAPVRVACGVRRLDDAGALRFLVDPATDSTREVAAAELAPRACPAAFAASVKLLASGPAAAAYEVEASHAGVLVEAAAAYPGWSARVDGAPAAVAVVDLVFRAVEVPAGRHSIELAYRPPGLSPGLGLALGSALALVALAARGARPPAAGC
jgi:hypothetical protein